MELSIRLQAVADFVTDGMKLADIGTDHGYIPIWLVESRKIPSAIAMDINQGPLEKAQENICLHGLEAYIKTRLSDGMKKLEPFEAESVVIAGMGGGLVIKILEEAKDRVLGIKEWILQPQSELKKVREYLNHSGYQIKEENMVLDEGKFYPMMKVTEGQEEPYSDAELCYGKRLLQNKNEILKQFLIKENSLKSDLLKKLQASSGESALRRVEELKIEIAVIQEALNAYDL